MSKVVIAWFSGVYVAVFWAFMGIRLFAMWRQNISVLTFAPKKPLLNALGVAGFLGILGAWSGLFVYLAFVPSAFALFRPWWDTTAAVGLAVRSAGAVLAVVGQCFMWVAVAAMGKAWRIGIDNKSPGSLVTHGVFRLSRNPIFVGMNASAVAAFMIHPNLFFLLCAVCLVVGIHFQIIGEERHLQRTYGDAYSRYRERTPRYVLFF